MKKTIIIMVIVLLLTACSKDNDKNIMYTDGILYDLPGNAVFGFDVSLAVCDKNASIEFVRFEGENVDDMTVKLNDDTFDNIKDISVDGYYLRLIGFACEAKSDVSISGVSLLIGGKEEKYEFSHPICHKIADMEYTGDIQVNNYPMIIMTSSYVNTEYQFSYSAGADAIIKSIYTNDFVKYENPEVYVNDKCIGVYRDSMPLNVKAGDCIKFVGNFSKKDDTVISDNTSIYFEVIMEYIESNQNHSISCGIISQGVSNEEDATKLLNMLVGKGE